MLLGSLDCPFGLYVHHTFVLELMLVIFQLIWSVKVAVLASVGLFYPHDLIIVLVTVTTAMLNDWVNHQQDLQEKFCMVELDC